MFSSSGSRFEPNRTFLIPRWRTRRNRARGLLARLSELIPRFDKSQPRRGMAAKRTIVFAVVERGGICANTSGAPLVNVRSG